MERMGESGAKRERSSQWMSQPKVKCREREARLDGWPLGCATDSEVLNVVKF